MPISAAIRLTLQCIENSLCASDYDGPAATNCVSHRVILTMSLRGKGVQRMKPVCRCNKSTQSLGDM